MASPGSRSMGARRGVALFCDVTLVAVHTQSGAARPGGVHTDGGIVSQAVARKRRKYADITNHPGAALLVLGSELYGRWCTDAVELLRELVALKGREAPPALRGRAAHTWANRWWSIVTVGTQRAVAESLIRHGGVDLQANPGPEDTPPLADLVADF